MELRAAFEQAWPAFALVAGLLLAGFAASEDGVFGWAAARLGRVRASPLALYGAALLTIALVTALLNLDTSVVFLTPLLVGVARAAGVDEEPFLYASVLMANASSLFLPGSNLTNLIVLSSEHVSGGVYAARIFPAALAACAVTGAALAFAYRGRLRAAGEERSELEAPRPGAIGLVAVAAVALLTVALRDPALPVLGAGLAAALAVAARRGIPAKRVVAAASPVVTLALLAAAVALGTLARAWHGPATLLSSAGRWGTAAVGALAAISLNNLPASVLLSAQPPEHARALLIGLNVGPNIAATGSLSAYLWFRAARQAGAQPSLRELTRRGAPIALLAGVAALASLGLTD
jgi:arsenical pump membrane protein